MAILFINFAKRKKRGFFLSLVFYLKRITIRKQIINSYNYGKEKIGIEE